MRVIACSLLVLGLACQPPELRLPPAPDATLAQASRVAQTRTWPLPVTRIFPQVLEVLLDLGYHIQSVNKELGHIAISQTWQDETLSGRPGQALELTLLFTPESPSTTRVRVAAWGRQAWVGDHGAEKASRPDRLSPEAATRLLDELAKRLRQE